MTEPILTTYGIQVQLERMGFTQREIEVVRELSERQDLPPEKVLRQALRLYQAHCLGACDVVWHGQSPIGCGVVE